jgi:hypothetical protein
MSAPTAHLFGNSTAISGQSLGAKPDRSGVSLSDRILTANNQVKRRGEWSGEQMMRQTLGASSHLESIAPGSLRLVAQLVRVPIDCLIALSNSTACWISAF